MLTAIKVKLPRFPTTHQPFLFTSATTLHAELQRRHKLSRCEHKTSIGHRWIQIGPPLKSCVQIWPCTWFRLTLTRNYITLEAVSLWWSCTLNVKVDLIPWESKLITGGWWIATHTELQGPWMVPWHKLERTHCLNVRWHHGTVFLVLLHLKKIPEAPSPQRKLGETLVAPCQPPCSPALS